MGLDGATHENERSTGCVRESGVGDRLIDARCVRSIGVEHA
jgi:hypothetical protein